MAYSTQTQIEAILGRALTAYEITSLAGVQAGVDLWIDNQTGVSFGTGSTTRYYDGGTTILKLDPCRAITAVELINPDLDDVYSYVVDENYIAGPPNDTVKTYLEKRSYGEGYFYDTWDEPGGWPSGSKRIAVTATFTYADTVPADIAYLSAYLSAKYLSANASAGSGATGDIVKESIEGYSREYANGASASGSDFASLNDAVVMSLLAAYTDQEIFF